MNRRVVRAVSGVICGGLAVSALVSLGLCAYCYLDVRSFRSGAQPVDATVVSVSRHPVDDQRGTEGYRMVVAFADPDGSEHRVPLSGLYRAEADAAGQRIALLCNPDHPVQVARESPWNWIGAWVYGGVSATFLLSAIVVFAVSRRWALALPPAADMSKTPNNDAAMH